MISLQGLRGFGLLLAAGAMSVALGGYCGAETVLPPTADQYLQQLNEVRKGGSRQSLQSLYELAVRSAPGIQAVLRDLSDTQYARLQARMEGFLMTRNETAAVRPSARFFLELAKRKGTKADIAFFEAYAATEPDSSTIFPAYIRQQNANLGCTIFSGPILTDLYRRWLTFRTTFPDAYTTEAQGELDAIDAELLSGTCACETSEKVAAGLDSFVRAFPDLPIAPKINARVERIKDGTSNIRFECHVR